MSEPKFTPGPWAEHGKGGCQCGEIWSPDGNALIARAFGPSHLGPDGPDCVPSERAQKANARLISAAPLGHELAVKVAEHFADTDAPLGKLAREFLAQVHA